MITSFFGVSKIGEAKAPATWDGSSVKLIAGSFLKSSLEKRVSKED